MLNDNQQMFYAVKSSSGQIVTKPVSDRVAAEQDRQRLNATLQEGSTIINVTSDGKELLLG